MLNRITNRKTGFRFIERINKTRSSLSSTTETVVKVSRRKQKVFNQPAHLVGSLADIANHSPALKRNMGLPINQHQQLLHSRH